MQERGKPEKLETTCRLVASSGNIPTCENPEYSDILPSFTVLELTLDSTAEVVTVFLVTHLLQKMDDNNLFESQPPTPQEGLLLQRRPSATFVKWGMGGGRRKPSSRGGGDSVAPDTPTPTASRQVSFSKGTAPPPPVTLASLDRDCFIIPVACLDRFLPAGVPVGIKSARITVNGRTPVRLRHRVPKITEVQQLLTPRAPDAHATNTAPLASSMRRNAIRQSAHRVQLRLKRAMLCTLSFQKTSYKTVFPEYGKHSINPGWRVGNCPRPVPKSSRSQSGSGYAHIKGTAEPFPARLLASYQGELGSIPGWGAPRFSQLVFVPDDAAGRWVFLEDVPFPPPLHSGVVPFSPHFTLIGSQDLVVESHLQSLIVNPPLRADENTATSVSVVTQLRTARTKRMRPRGKTGLRSTFLYPRRVHKLQVVPVLGSCHEGLRGIPRSIFRYTLPERAKRLSLECWNSLITWIFPSPHEGLELERRWGRGGAVVRVLASHQDWTGLDSRLFAREDHAGRCRWSVGGFLRDLPPWDMKWRVYGRRDPGVVEVAARTRQEDGHEGVGGKYSRAGRAARPPRGINSLVAAPVPPQHRRTTLLGPAPLLCLHGPRHCQPSSSYQVLTPFSTRSMAETETAAQDDYRLFTIK
ncbi:hypothetical protein PR048_014687 [Dryococelus australis]|uniref:Uncharacterized protein n=1 Tax=Dryococelus australis TaxID=614101 RepID=A0ABQ9HEW7_9NEOP|nr:hypothetical protein PR048_014687 [Dryococelus australis]